MTKREMYEVIKVAMVENEEVVAFCEHEIELISKKKSVQTKTQKENVAITEVIYKALAEVGRPVTVSELIAENPEVAQYSVSKVSALLKPLKDNGRVVRTVDKKKAYYTVA